MPDEKRTATLTKIGLAVLGAIMIAATVVVALTGERGPGPGFVTAENGEFMLDGEPFYYAGTNNYEQMYTGEPLAAAFFALAAEQEMTGVRTWAFYDAGTADGQGGVEINNRGTFFQYWDPELGRPAYNEGASGLERLDYMVWAAKENGVKLVLPLVNNWTAFGGVDQYVRWAGGQYHDEFFYDEQIKQWYKDWVEYLLNRVNTYTGVAYKDEPAIMIWELGNELRCSDSGAYPLSPDGCTPEAITAWADEMSTFVRSIDKNHLIGFGGEGFLCDEPGGDYWLTNCSAAGDPGAILALPNIDVHGIHVYPNHWNPEPPHEDWAEFGDWWIERHGQLANEHDKPYYIGEYGWLERSSRLPVFDRWLQTFHDNGGDGSHFWIMHPRASLANDPDSHGFTERCPSTVCTLVAQWTLHTRDGVPASDLPPLADGDFTSTRPGTGATLDVLANDHFWGDAPLDPATIDLDPGTPGLQPELSHELGTVTVADGMLVFTPAGSGTGTITGSYTVTDSVGRTTPPAPFGISVISAG